MTGYKSTYEWRCSPLDTSSNKYYFPDLGGRAQVLGYTRQPSSFNYSYIYSVNDDALNCSGTVTAVEYCYNTGSNSHKTVFTLLILTHSNDRFIVDRNIQIRFVENQNQCGDPCCEVRSLLDGDQFVLPARNFLIGVTIEDEGPNLLGFDSSSHPGLTAPDSYLYLGAPEASSMPIDLGTMQSQALRLMWLHISK